mmetsp:Transcript_19793/g.51129  ORF Transcript_19793/g.51129 Transcript_19793/m.51129 type:complete len:325 (-) Transcript_19793:84-1058(-)
MPPWYRRAGRHARCLRADARAAVVGVLAQQAAQLPARQPCAVPARLRGVARELAALAQRGGAGAVRHLWPTAQPLSQCQVPVHHLVEAPYSLETDRPIPRFDHRHHPTDVPNDGAYMNHVGRDVALADGEEVDPEEGSRLVETLHCEVQLERVDQIHKAACSVRMRDEARRRPNLCPDIAASGCVRSRVRCQLLAQGAVAAGGEPLDDRHDARGLVACADPMLGLEPAQEAEGHAQRQMMGQATGGEVVRGSRRRPARGAHQSLLRVASLGEWRRLARGGGRAIAGVGARAASARADGRRRRARCARGVHRHRRARRPLAAIVR